MNEKFDPATIEAEENLLIDFQFLLQEAVTHHGVTLSQLAEKAGVSKARISQIMSPEANPTIKSMARLFHALGESVGVSRKTNAEAFCGIAPKVDAQTWHWTETDKGKTRVDERLVAVVKDTGASNDNYGDRFLFIDSELEAA